jgi:hypothetical protein
VDGPAGLVARTPQEHRDNGIDVRTATAGDRHRRPEGHGHDEGSGSESEGSESLLTYDQLVLATGAEPVVPDVPGADATGVHGVQTLDDGCRLLETLGHLDETRPRRAVIVGAGYIGARWRGVRRARPRDDAARPGRRADGHIDQDLARMVRDAMQGMGITTVMGTSVEAFETDADGRVTAVATPGRAIPPTWWFWASGCGRVRAGTRRRAAARALRRDPDRTLDGRARTTPASGLRRLRRVVGPVRRDFTHVPLGTHANKQGRSWAQLSGDRLVFAGSSAPASRRSATSRSAVPG